MEAITVHPKNKEQFTLVAALLGALKIPFEKVESDDSYDPHVKRIYSLKRT